MMRMETLCWCSTSSSYLLATAPGHTDFVLRQRGRAVRVQTEYSFLFSQYCTVENGYSVRGVARTGPKGMLISNWSISQGPPPEPMEKS